MDPKFLSTLTLKKKNLLLGGLHQVAGQLNPCPQAIAPFLGPQRPAMGYLLLWGVEGFNLAPSFRRQTSIHKDRILFASGNLQLAPSSSEPLSLPVSSIMPCLHLRSDLQHRIKRAVVHTCNPST